MPLSLVQQTKLFSISSLFFAYFCYIVLSFSFIFTGSIMNHETIIIIVCAGAGGFIFLIIMSMVVYYFYKRRNNEGVSSCCSECRQCCCGGNSTYVHQSNALCPRIICIDPIKLSKLFIEFIEKPQVISKLYC